MDSQPHPRARADRPDFAENRPRFRGAASGPSKLGEDRVSLRTSTVRFSLGGARKLTSLCRMVGIAPRTLCRDGAPGEE